MANKVVSGPDRRRLFRVAALLFPIVLIILVELILRLAGYGAPASFFLKETENGRQVWIENSHVADRFFPLGMARGPTPISLPRTKEPGTKRIFVFGESAAQGDPEPAYGFSRILDVLLRERFPTLHFEIVNVSIVAINSHVLLPIARECASMDGDFWLIYAGNNEVVGPFGAGTVFGHATPPRWWIGTTLFIKETRLGQLVSHAASKLGKPPQKWGGMEMFLGKTVSETDPRLPSVYKNFSSNLGEMVSVGQRHGAEVIVSTMVSNLKDCAPFASLEGSRRFLDGKQALGSGPGGRPRALEEFSRARDLDELRFRADTKINQIIRDVANHTSSAQLIDAEKYFLEQSPEGITGREFLLEHVHFNFEGNYRLARLFAEAIDKKLTPKATSTTSNWLDAAVCADRLAFTEWNREQYWTAMWKRMQDPPFTGQTNHLEQIAWFEQQMKQSKAALHASSADKIVAEFRNALGHHSNDWVLHEFFADFLENHDDAKQALSEWRQVTELMPHWAPGFFHMGNSAQTLGKSEEARRYFKQAIVLNPRSAESWHQLALTESNTGNPNEAIRCFQKVLELRPDFAPAYVNWANLLMKSGETAQGLAMLDKAVVAAPQSALPHLTLANYYASRNQPEDSLKELSNAVSAEPDNVSARFQLASAYDQAGRSVDAIKELQETLRLDPGFARAHILMGLELVRLGRPGSREEFAAAVEADPNDVDARLNLGVALSKEQQLEEAQNQFERAVQLNPSSVQGHLDLGLVYLRRNSIPMARREFGTVLQLDSSNSAAKHYLESLDKKP